MDEANLLEMIRAGGTQRRQAIADLYRHYELRFRRYYYKNGVREDQARDMVQDVFVNIVRGCADFRADADFEVWLWKIARNRLMDYFRRPRRVTESIDPDCEPPAEDRDEQYALQECVRQAFARFGLAHPERASALRLAALEGWTIAQLATLLERTPGATREFLSQCRKVLEPFITPCRDYLAEEA